MALPMRQIGVGLLATLLGVAMLECGVRVLLPPLARGNFTAVPQAIRERSDTPGLPYALKPGAVVRQLFPGDASGYFGPDETLTYRINEQGFRGPAVSREKPPGSFRIVGLGDSFTFGTGVREEDTFLAVLRRELAERGRYEVLNLGVMGYDTRAEIALLRKRGLDFAPDLVVVCLFLNDAGGGVLRDALNTAVPTWELPWWRRHFQLVDRVLAIREGRRAMAALVRSYDESFADAAPGWSEARAALRDAKRLGEGRDFRLALVLFPVLYGLSDGYPFAAPHEAVRAFAEQEALPLLDLLPAFAGHDGPELWVHPANQHPNARAHEIAGRALLSFLEREGLLAH